MGIKSRLIYRFALRIVIGYFLIKVFSCFVRADTVFYTREVMLPGLENEQQIALDWLWQKMRSDSMVGVSAEVILAGAKDRPISQNKPLIELLRSHPFSSLEQRILAESSGYFRKAGRHQGEGSRLGKIWKIPGRQATIDPNALDPG